MSAPIVFLASFPPIQSSIKIGQDGARVQLDIPETEMDAVQRLLGMRGKVLRVTVEDEDGEEDQPRVTGRRAG